MTDSVLSRWLSHTLRKSSDTYEDSTIRHQYKQFLVSKKLMRALLLVLCWLLMSPRVWAEASRSFDGTNDTVSWGNNLDVTTGSFSLCAWTNMTEDATADIIASKKLDGTGSTPGYFLAQLSTDLMRCYAQDTSSTTAGTTDSTTDVDGVWYCICCVWDGGSNDDMYIYVNGTNESSDTADAEGSITTTQNFIVGELADGSVDALGLISYVSFASRVFRVQEVLEVQWHSCSIDLDACLPLWGDSTEIDLGPSDLSGTVAGATTSTNGPPTMVGGYMVL